MVTLSIILTMVTDSGFRLWSALAELFWPALIFTALAVFVKREKIFEDLRAAKYEMRINFLFHVINVFILAPLVLLTIVITENFVGKFEIALVPTTFWETLNGGVLLIITVFFGDLVGYLRHRIEHTRLLWPVHAVHHSDTHLTWLSFARVHPINQITTAIFDLSILLLLGFPDWAITGAFLFRHYYGMVIHADLPWTYGWLGHVFVSPAMHKWHHVKEGEAIGTNFSIVFAFIDKLFGTFYLPGPCTVETGVEEEMGSGLRNQLTYPLKVWQGWLDQIKDPSASAYSTENTGGRSHPAG